MQLVDLQLAVYLFRFSVTVCVKDEPLNSLDHKLHSVVVYRL